MDHTGPIETDDELIGPSRVADELGVCLATVRNWDKYLTPIRTPAGVRRYKLSKILEFKIDGYTDKLLTGKE